MVLSLLGINSKKVFNFNNLRKIPIYIPCILLIFFVLGMMNMYSISLGKGEWYFRKFLIFWILSIIPFVLTVSINIKYLIKISYFFYICVICILCGVLIVGDVSMGARRWFDLGFIKIQPSEFAKIAVIFVIARYYHFAKSHSSDGIFNTFTTLIVALVPAGLVVMQPDLGSAVVILCIAFLMIFANGIKWRWLIGLAVIILMAMPIVWHKMHDYQKDRILIFLNPEKDVMGAGYNVIQSKIAIGSGGFTGKGYTKNDQSSLKFLPENQTDFAFTVFAEEFGFVGAVLFVFCYFCLVMYGIFVSCVCVNYFGKMLALGISATLFIHIVVNLMMIMGFVPVVGIPLPFVSYGGTFLMFCVFCVAILTNVDINKNLAIHSNAKTYMLR